MLYQSINQPNVKDLDEIIQRWHDIINRKDKNFDRRCTRKICKTVYERSKVEKTGFIDPIK